MRWPPVTKITKQATTQISQTKVVTTSRMQLEPLVVMLEQQVLELALPEPKLITNVVCSQISQ